MTWRVGGRAWLFGVLAAVAAAAGACGSSGGGASTATTGAPPGPPATVRLVGAEAPCGEPVAPTATAQAYPEQESLPAVTGTDVLVGARGLSATLVRAPDSDGDGSPDEVVARQTGKDPVALHRADGTLTFTTSRPGQQVGAVTSAGDLDGDGRDEVAVVVAGGTAGQLGAVHSWISTGPLEPGTVDVATGGTVLDGSVVAPGVIGGLAPDELVVVDGSLEADDATTTIVRRADLAAALGVGGEVPVVVRQRGQLLGWIDGASGRLLVTGAVSATGDAGIVRIGDASTCRAFTTAPSRWLPGSPQPVTPPKVLVGPDGVSVVVEQSSRSGAASYLWRVPGWVL